MRHRRPEGMNRGACPPHRRIPYLQPDHVDLHLLTPIADIGKTDFLAPNACRVTLEGGPTGRRTNESLTAAIGA